MASSPAETRSREYYNPTGGGGARCWGSTPTTQSPRQFWWSLRGIHVDPTAPVSNDELEELRNLLLQQQWSWGSDLLNSTNEAMRDGSGGDGSVGKEKNGTQSKNNGWIDATSVEWQRMPAPPGPPSNTNGMKETTEALIEAKVGNDGEETVAGLAIASGLLVLMVTLVLGAWLKRKKIMWLHQSGAALLLGITGGVYMITEAYAQDLRSKDGLGGEKNWILTYGDYLVFDTEFFFLFLLPPIIFESGYAIDAEPFFRNIGKIAYFAFVGTIIGSFTFGMGMYFLGLIGLSHQFSFVNAMLFGSIIGATDPVTVLSIFTDLKVNPDLFAVVFGESVMNDAVAVVLYRAIYILEDTFSVSSFLQAAWAFVVVFLGSTFIGVATALASALFFKRVKLSGDDAHLDHPEATHANQAGMSTKGNNAATSGSGNGTGSNTNTGTGKNVNSPLRPGAPATARSALNETSIVKTHKGVGLEVLMKGATLEASVVALFPWIAYMLAEALGLVGIVSILFCGIVMGHYTRRNLSEGGRALSSGAFSILAQLSETFVFIYCGASVFLAQKRFFPTAAWTVVMCLASRALVVFPGVGLINRHARRRNAGGFNNSGKFGGADTGNGDSSSLLGNEGAVSDSGGGFGDAGKSKAGAARRVVSQVARKTLSFGRAVFRNTGASFFGGGAPIPDNHAKMLWFSGLRGAMAFALAMEAAAKRGEDGRAMLTSTLGAVLFTVLVVGGATVPALKRLNIECNVFDTKDKAFSGNKGLPERASGGSSVLPNTVHDPRATASLKRGAGRRLDSPAAFGSNDEPDEGSGSGSGFDFNSIDVRESFHFIDRQYITPMFTLDEGNRDGNSYESSGGGEHRR